MEEINIDEVAANCLGCMHYVLFLISSWLIALGNWCFHFNSVEAARHSYISHILRCDPPLRGNCTSISSCLLQISLAKIIIHLPDPTFVVTTHSQSTRRANRSSETVLAVRRTEPPELRRALRRYVSGAGCLMRFSSRSRGFVLHSIIAYTSYLCSC